MNYSSLRILGDLTVAPGGANAAPGPTGKFVWDKTTLYNSGYGMKNGQRVYKSVNQSADGAGGTTYWYRYYQNGEWLIARNSTTAHLVFTGGTGNTVCTPKFTFPSGTVQYIVEGGATGFLTSGVEANFALGVGVKVHFICSNWDAITQIDLNTDKLSGVITNIVWPANLTILYLYNNQLAGVITNIVWPANLTILFLSTNQLTGVITNIVWPANLTYLYLHINVGLEGDFSQCTTGTKLQYVHLYNTGITYSSTGGPFSIITNALREIDFDNCSLAQGHVDNVLADLVTSGIDNSVSSKTVEIGDNNSAPSAAGLASKATLEGRGWTTKVTA